jgi:hypothetical protein
MKSISLSNLSFWNSLKLTDQLQKNLDILYKKLGSKFIISYKRNVMPLYFFKKKSENKANTYYVMKYGVKMTKNTKLYPFYISMYYNVNNVNLQDVNDVYIRNISAIEKGDYDGQKPINGSTVVEMVLLLLKRLHVDNAYLNDGAGIKCEGNDERNIYLSPFKLLEKRRTFYMKFGFKPVLTEHMKRDGQYKSITTFMKMVDKSIDKISKIDMSDVHKYLKQMINLINRIYIKDDFEKVEIHRYIPEEFSEGKLNKTKNKEIFEKYRASCMMLKKSMPSNGNLLRWIKMIFYKECKEYKNFMEVMLPWNIGVIFYNKKMYKIKYKKDFMNMDDYTSMNFKIELR